MKEGGGCEVGGVSGGKVRVPALMLGYTFSNYFLFHSLVPLNSIFSAISTSIFVKMSDVSFKNLL